MKILVSLSFLFLLGCSQESILWLSSVKKSSLFSVDQILRESGISQAKIKKTIVTEKSPQKQEKKAIQKKKTLVKSPKNDTIYPELVSEKLQLAPNTVFTIFRNESHVFFILKRVLGDLSFLSNQSQPSKGKFVFKTGKKEGGIQIQLYDLSGVLQTNIVYTISLLYPKPIVTNNAEKTNVVIVSKVPKTVQQKENLLLYNSILASLRGLSITEQIRKISATLAQPDIPNLDKEQLLRHFIELYLQNREFSKADIQIRNLKEKGSQYYYTGLSQSLQKRPQEAIISFSEGIDLKSPFVPRIILELEKTLLKTGLVNHLLLEKLEQKTDSLSDDRNFYINSKIYLARLYPFTGKVEKAQRILKALETQNINVDLKKKLTEAKKEILRDFLNYR